MEAVLKVHSKIGIVSLSLYMISVGLSTFIKANVLNYDTAFPVLCVMVIISITALMAAIVALKKDKIKRCSQVFQL
ncbi:hypothetical protein [Anaerocolumna xylanovorans]|uniref:Uncharacterized protein n=1 Tax=Anaerocolumna xylanovorans DSM 12503 TaxID=1121345 RepID=A0A1M7YHG8_9FIRM|nr:hypothetical protein [Anaerocolumna xylanovorans]SHO52031.1 hypothetical protein SAMN02745217_03471 [Anaerocolumna xylanovorans DSM 12503]